MNEEPPKHPLEDVIPLYILGFLAIAGASLSGFVSSYSIFLAFFLPAGCVVGFVLLIKQTYSLGFDHGQQSKPLNQKGRRRNRAKEKIWPLNPNPPRLVVNNVRRVH